MSRLRLALALFLSTPALASGPALAVPDAPRPASVSVTSSQIEWRPAVPGAGLTLTVSGPDGFYLRQESSGGASAVFSLFDEEGATRPEGVYVYEVRLALALDDEARRSVEPLRGTNKVGRLLVESGLGPPYTVQSGSFRIVDGAIVQGVAEQRPAGPNVLADKATVLTLSDGSIVDSLCVGFDCSSSPPFGDSTVLLQETTVRLKFDDTSTSSFPDRDWELTANDTGSEVLERFSISDCGTGSGAGCADVEVFSVEAGVRENALYIEADGEIGIGTANPVADIHIVTGDTPKMRLEQDGSQGFTAQTWEVLGNEAGFLVQDVTAGGSVYPFRIEPGAGTHRLVIDSAGNIGMGTVNPAAHLHVVGADGDTKLLIAEGSATVTGRQLLELRNNGNVNFILVNTAAGGEDWQILAESAGSFPGFSISRQGSGARELRLTDAGDLMIEGDYFSATCTSPSSPCAPDYVFSPDYDLMPLDALAAFVESERHLPNVPSEAEIRAAGGVNLSRFQMRLLEKIEELTLYTLAQQRAIEALETRLAAALEDRRE